MLDGGATVAGEGRTLSQVTRTREAARPAGPASAARPPRLGFLVFVVGASSLGAEIAAARLVAPHFGASTVIWANTIATVLLALALGYWLGGTLADRAPHRRGLSRLILAAAVLLAAVPFAGGPLLEASAESLGTAGTGELVGSLLAIVLLVAPPVLLLGCVAPYALRLTVPAVEAAGSAAGRLYAISTLGSLVGVWISALVLLPLIGTRLTFLSFAVALGAAAAPGLLRPRW
jgi:predicted membrane-bound spermidine synthase